MADAVPALRRAASAEWRILALALALLAGLLGWQNGLGRPDFTLYDAAITWSGRPASDEIVIIAIDEASLAAIGRWPWPRAIHAALLDKISLSRPKAIALDLILSEPEKAASDPERRGAAGAGAADAALARAMINAAPVVLPVLMEGDSGPGQRAMRATLPLPALAASAAALGHIHVEIDTDGITRSVFLREGPARASHLPHDPENHPAIGSAQKEPTGQEALTSQTVPTRQAQNSRLSKAPPWPHFGLALKQAAAGGAAASDAALPGERAPSPGRTGAWQRDYWLHLPFAGPPGTYARVSYVDALLGRLPPGVLQGKYVLVGATAAGLGDAYPTPVSGQSRAMPGVEINANVLDALLSGRGIVYAPAWANALLSVAIVLFVLYGLLALTPRRGLLLVACSLTGVLGAAWGALALAGVWFAPAACLLAIALAYPLWSWRRLEATLSYLGQEFARLDAEPDILPRAPAQPGSKSTDLLERRIRAVEAAAQRLRDTRRFTADTLGNLPDATLVADRAGKILLANRAAAQLFNLASAADLRDRQIASLFAATPASSGRSAAFSWESLCALALNAEAARGAPSAAPSAAPSESIALDTPDGRHVLAHCSRSADSRGATIGWIVSLIDITALRQAETKRDEVLAFLSHDMRAPQASIIALLELHALDPARNSKEDVHARIENYARKTLDLSDQFLQLSRAETKEYEFAALDLSEIAEEAIDEIWAASSAKQIGIDWRFDGEPAPVSADRAMLTRATANLLSNAVKYSPENSCVTVTLTAREGWFVLEVADQGYGISLEDQKHLFERYRRFSTPGAPKAAGAGLGMVFVKTVIEKHGGQIAVKSEPGSGTRISLSVPAFTQ